jgi:hypothetical protein
MYVYLVYLCYNVKLNITSIMEKELVAKVFEAMKLNLESGGTTSDLKNLSDVYLTLQGILDMKRQAISPPKR